MALTKAHNRMISGAEVNVIDFGADPTNTTDSSTAIQDAIDSITEGTVIFPAGDYRIDDEITITKNNITLLGLTTATLIVPSTTDTTTGVAINLYDNSGSQPVNCHLENINVEISSNSGGNSAGIRYGGSRGSFKNVSIRIRGDNMTGLILQQDDAGSGPYYNTFTQVFAQGDSNSTTVLTGTTGYKFLSSAVSPSRSPNANTFTRCRAGSVYNAFSIRGAGNTFEGCTSEAINNYHYYCDHPSVSSGCIATLISNPYCEQYSTSTVLECGTNASGTVLLKPYNTGVSAIFSDNSTLQNNRLVDVATLPLQNSPVIRASAKVTGTTINSGFNADTVTTSGTGIYRLNFDTTIGSANYFVSCIPTGTDVSARISVYNANYIQFYFFDDTGAATNPSGFNVVVYK
jgi:hypothetical protein